MKLDNPVAHRHFAACFSSRRQIHQGFWEPFFNGIIRDARVQPANRPTKEGTMTLRLHHQKAMTTKHGEAGCGAGAKQVHIVIDKSLRIPMLFTT